MEALAALGLASNVVQFIQFLSELISNGSEIAGSVQGASKRSLELEQVYKTLSDLSIKLQCGSNQSGDAALWLRGIIDQSTNFNERKALREHIQALENLATDCNLLCEQLLDIIRKFRVHEGPYRPLKSFIAALKTAWNMKKVNSLEEKIHMYQRAISLHFFPLLRCVHPPALHYLY